MRLKGFALSQRMVVLPEYKTAYIYLSKEDLARFNHKVGDTEGFVNMPLSVDGVVFSAFFMEKRNHIKISFRSKGDFDVNVFASKYFKGGGHKNASGGKSDLKMPECIEYFESLLPGLVNP